MDLPQLRDFITRNFNDSELRDLCFDLGIEYENLGGDNKAAKARELVAYCQRHGRLIELEGTCRRLRPNAALEIGRDANVSASNAPTINRSGGLDIHATTVNIYGDVAGRDKATSSGSESDQTPTSS
jgi:hypothetical protein